MLPLSLIVAVSTNRVIGRAGTLPWKFSEDMKYFRRVTSSSVPPAERAIIMGRKTHQSIGKALPKRHNIVVTRTPTQPMQKIVAAECSVASSLEEAIDVARIIDSEPIIIGGASIYAEALPLATKLYVTTVHADYEGDVFMSEEFPSVDLTPVTPAGPLTPVTPAVPMLNLNTSAWKIIESRISVEEDALTGRNATMSWVTVVRV
jgi:dihydrofolate reductase